MTECKLLKIIGHDGSDHHIKACPFECSRTNMNDPRPIGLAFFISKATKGTAHIEMKMSVENEKKQKTIVLHKNSRCTKSPLCYDPLLDIIDGYYVRYWDWNWNMTKKHKVTFDLYIEIEEYIEPEDVKAKAKMKVLSDVEPSLSEALQDLRLYEESSDITIRCDNEAFPCHKLILGSRSDVFKTMFAMSDSKEEQNGIIEIEDISAKTMKTFLNFMYKDDLEIEEIDCNLLIAAEKYNFKRLFNICLKQIEKMIDANTVMEITIAAYLVDNKQLLMKASEFIFKNRGSIKKCELWDQIKSKHPAIAAKVMDLMVFDEE